MRCYEVRDSFGLENLRLTERPDPELGPGDVRVRMRAASVNYRDLLMIRGMYNPKQPLPLIPLSDGVGEVIEVADAVTRVAVGDRVSGIFSQGFVSNPPTLERIRATLGGPVDGTLAEQMVIPAESVVKVPAYLTDAEAATLPCAALTAWTSLCVEGDVKAGDRVLVLGTGGVSIFALQFAKMLGAEVIVTSSSDEKLERATALGASHTINYRTHPKWWREVVAYTGREGLDHVIEVGGAGTFDQSVQAVKVGGHISLIGILSGAMQPVNMVRVLMKNIRVQGIIVGCRDSFEAMNRALALHELRPVVDRVFPFEEARAALDYVAAGEHFGKVAIEF